MHKESFSILAENKAIFIREDSQTDFATGNLFQLFSQTSTPCLRSKLRSIISSKCVRSMVQTTRKIWSIVYANGTVPIGNQECSCRCQICPSLNDLLGLNLCYLFILPISGIRNVVADAKFVQV